ncbi:hypothetical protein AGIG_G7571 [Arapaima gigas]
MHSAAPAASSWTPAQVTDFKDPQARAQPADLQSRKDVWTPVHPLLHPSGCTYKVKGNCWVAGTLDCSFPTSSRFSDV